MREIPEVDDATVAFPAQVIGELLPPMADIPEEFPSRAEFEGVACRWFFLGLKKPVFYPKEGVDPKKAFRVLQACIGSYEPKHEHKITGVAYLMSEWFEKIEIEGAG
jgi:hypothetical protein